MLPLHIMSAIMKKKESLSVVIPSYNCRSVELVARLHEQAERASRVSPAFRYEIIVADDGSTDKATVAANRSINAMSHCRYIERGENVGRAAIRNILAREARYDYLLFIDGDAMIVSDDYLSNYLGSEGDDIVNGGVSIVGDYKALRHNLRFVYEYKASPHHDVESRQREPYKSFRSTNFLVRRQLMMSHPFDERVRRYGYEDVLFGKAMREAGHVIRHIDAPVGIGDFEDNAAFIAKTEEALRTLYAFRHDLVGYSPLLSAAMRLRRWRLLPLLRLSHRLFGSMERHVLEGSRPNLAIFRLYKMGYLASLANA